MRLLAAVAVIAGGLVAIGVVAAVGSPTDTQVLPPDPVIDRIAYVTPEGEIWTAAPDGSSRSQLSPADDGFYTWPTWSPDGRTIVFSAVLGDAAENVRVLLLEAELAEGTVSSLHSGATGFVGLLAEDVVHYPIWSPDGAHLAFIAGREDGLALLLDDRSDDAPPREILGDGPLWLSWSADSRFLLAHRGQDNILIDVGSGDAVDGYPTTRVDSLAERYRVSAWSPADARFAYVERDGGGDHVIVMTTPDGARTRIDRAPVIHSALSWSPDARHLAVHGTSGITTYMGQQVILGEGFRLYDASGVPTDLGVGDVMIAMFWSPEGSRIAYVTAPDARGTLSWRLYDVDTNESRLLAEFIPSGPQLVLFSFFDQYALSHSPWSHDGRSLVFAGRLWRGVVTAAQTSGSQVIVLPVDNPAGGAPIAEGLLAFPSPR